MIKLVRVVRNVEFGQLFDSFFISAITTILAVRFYLSLTGYPQIGSSTLHISHLLPGVILMLTALLVLLAAVNRAARGFAAVLAGIGFGLAWDELGKFITKNNDYFFHATPGLIYLTFIGLYLIVRYSAQRRFTDDDYLANVLDLIKDAAAKDLDPREYAHAKELLSHVAPSHVLYGPTKTLVAAVKPNAKHQETEVDRLVNLAKRPFEIVSRRPDFPRMVVGVAMAYGLISLVTAVVFLAGATLPDARHISTILNGDESDLIGGLSALVAASFSVAATVKYLTGQPPRAYRLFELGLLVNIFLGQVILFFKNQGVALVWLAITLFLLINLKLLIGQNQVIVKKVTEA